MSRWLKSVNNLLENLDGQAETVIINTTTTSNNEQQQRQQATANTSTGLLLPSINDGYDEYYDEDDDEDDDEDEDEEYTTEEEEEEEEVVDFETSNNNNNLNNHNLNNVVEQDQAKETIQTKTTLPSESSQQRNRTDSVSELSFSEDYDEEFIMNAVSGHSQTKKNIISLRHPMVAAAAATTTTTLTTASSPKIDESPKKPRRSLENAVLLQRTIKAKEVEKTAPSPASTTTMTNTNLSQPLPTSSLSVPISKAPISSSSSSSKKKKDTFTSTATATAAPSSVSSNNNKIQSLQTQISKLQNELVQSQTTNITLQQQIGALQQKLQHAEQEMDAQAKELQNAGQELQTIRENAKTEQEDILDDHEEEIEEIQKKHSQEIDSIRQQYETTIAEYKQQLEMEQLKRQQEGGNWNQELEDAIQREKDALTTLHQISLEKTELKTKYEQLITQHSELQDQLESSINATKTSADREKKAQDELDETKALHTKQIQQRQHREAELEQTIAQLGSALSLAKQQQQQQQNERQNQIHRSQATGEVSTSDTNEIHMDYTHYKEQWEQTYEELESIKVQLTLEVQRREALQQELNEIVKERTEEIATAHNKQQHMDRKVSELESTISKLQASLIRSNSNFNDTPDTIQHSSSHHSNNNNNNNNNHHNLSPELHDAKIEITRLSEQLIRQQNLVEHSKSEILALKGRLQAAIKRAEEAEKIQFNISHQQSTIGGDNKNNNNNRLYDMESDGGGGGNIVKNVSMTSNFATRRRIKGRTVGGVRGGRTGVRSIRSALRIGSGQGNPTLEQMAMTVDAVDSWMVDTGSFMKSEPFARLGFLLYLMILHIWTFALVVFHTTEVEHGDFGSMDSNPRHWRDHSNN